ncbi:MAG: hypothetical protein AAB779_03060, partial [Patescibacteria group bacterium]
MTRICAFLLVIAAALAACGNKGILNAPEMPVIEEDAELAAKLVVGKNKAGGSCEKCGGIKLIRNTAMADATPGVPTGVEGATAVRLASVVLVAENGSEKYGVESLALMNDILPKEVLGAVFRNLRLYDYNRTQLGQTIGTLIG